jgi:hypothetical protein
MPKTRLAALAMIKDIRVNVGCDEAVIVRVEHNAETPRKCGT